MMSPTCCCRELICYSKYNPVETVPRTRVLSVRLQLNRTVPGVFARFTKCRTHSALMLASLIIGHHFSISAF
jgi:hypothetical protein